VTRRDCLLIDYVTEQDAKGSDGKPLGKPLLMASFSAYREIEEGPMPTAEDPDAEGKRSRLREFLQKLDSAQKEAE
jgi:hypothetical protein